jgi:ParB/RepB/Spo0J family partition protein
MTTTTQRGELRLALAEIRVRENVRGLDADHVDALAQSIALRGLLVPLIVRRVDGGYELVAGYHRIAACRQLGLDDAPVVVREHEGSSADSAAENVTRKQLSPLEEARAVQAMLDEGYTLDGVAQALGWSRQLVTARAKILKLPPAGQQLVGTGQIPVGAIDTLLAIQAVCEPIAETVIAAVDAGDVNGSELVRDATWAIGRALHRAPKDVFAAYLNTVDHRDVSTLRLGKKAEAALTEAEQLHKQLDRYAYGPPTIRFTDADVDQARAAGVLLELDGARGRAIITDKALYRELAKQAITRTVEELRARVAAKDTAKRTSPAKRERTPREELDVEHRASLRELTRQAHGSNLDLGAALLTELATVAADDIDVARFFAYGLLGPETSSYLGTSDHVARTIAANGLRLVLDEHRTTNTPTLKSGKAGKTKVTYGDLDDVCRWLWRFVDGAKTAGELYGRVLVVFAAQHYATQLVLPTSQRRGSVLPRSHKDTARKAFERVTKRVLPGSYTRLQRALAAETRSYQRHIAELATRAQTQHGAVVEPETNAEPGDDEPLGEDIAEVDDVDEGSHS